MHDLTFFSFETGEIGQTVRVAEIDDRPWFVAADVCRVLRLSNPTMALRALAADEKKLVSGLTLNLAEDEGFPQQLSLISEGGLYKLVGRSDKPEAPALLTARIGRASGECLIKGGNYQWPSCSRFAGTS